MNWKTTIAGAVAAGLYVLEKIQQEGRALEDWKTWIFPVSLAVLAFLTKDSSKPAP